MLSSQPNCWQDEVFGGGEVWVLVGTGKSGGVGGCLMAVSSRVAGKDQEIWDHSPMPSQAVVSFLGTSSSFPLSQSLLFYKAGVGGWELLKAQEGLHVVLWCSGHCALCWERYLVLNQFTKACRGCKMLDLETGEADCWCEKS